jgi:hypothetical protein
MKTVGTRYPSRIIQEVLEDLPPERETRQRTHKNDSHN